MGLSDVLFDAVAEIESLEKHSDAYDDLTDWIAYVKKAMNDLRMLLDTAPGSPYPKCMVVPPGITLPEVWELPPTVTERE